MSALMTAVRLGLSIATIFVIGWPVTWILLPKRQAGSYFFETMAFSFSIGTGLLTLGMLFVALFNGSLDLLNILISCLILNLLLTKSLATVRHTVLVNPFPRLRDIFNNLTTLVIFRGFSVLEIILFIIIGFEIIFVFSETLLYPMSEHDPLSHWALKSKAFFFQRQITFEGFEAHNYYPLLVPLFETWIYLGLGYVNDGLAKIFLPFCFVSLLILFYYFQRQLLFSRKHSLLFTVFLITCGGQVIRFSTVAYADIPLTFFYMVGTLALYLWMVSPQENCYLMLSGFFLGLGVWTKLEGAALLGINSLVLALYYLLNWRTWRKNKVDALIVYIFLILLYFVPWFIFRKMNGVDASSEHLGSLHLQRLPLIVNQLTHAFLEYKRWGMLWIVVLITTGLTYKKSLSSPIFFYF